MEWRNRTHSILQFLSSAFKVNNIGPHIQWEEALSKLSLTLTKKLSILPGRLTSTLSWKKIPVSSLSLHCLAQPFAMSWLHGMDKADSKDKISSFGQNFPGSRDCSLWSSSLKLYLTIIPHINSKYFIFFLKIFLFLAPLLLEINVVFCYGHTMVSILTCVSVICLKNLTHILK